MTRGGAEVMPATCDAVSHNEGMVDGCSASEVHRSPCLTHRSQPTGADSMLRRQPAHQNAAVSRCRRTKAARFLSYDVRQLGWLAECRQAPVDHCGPAHEVGGGPAGDRKSSSLLAELIPLVQRLETGGLDIAAVGQVRQQLCLRKPMQSGVSNAGRSSLGVGEQPVPTAEQVADVVREPGRPSGHGHLACRD